MKNKQPKHWWQKKSTNRIWFGSIIKGLLLSLLLSTSACTSIESNPEETKETKDILTLENAVLEQSNSSGQVLWKIKSDRTVYSRDRKIAYLDKIIGNVLQDGVVILRLSAEKGEIHNNGAEIYLKEKILAVDTRNQAVIQAESGTWYPEQELLIVEQNVTGTHPKMNVWGDRGRYYSNKQMLELEGEIMAVMSDPSLKMTTPYISWNIAQQKVIASAAPQNKSNEPRPIIYHYRAEKITDRFTGDRITVDLEKNTATLQKNASLKYTEPPVTISTDTATWHYQKQLVTSVVPISIIHATKQILITGNQGQIDLKQEIAHLKGGTSGINNLDQSQLFADQLIWRIPQELIEGIGNVYYQQVDPAFNITGTKAYGKLSNNQIIVTGNSSQPTVTKIYP